MKKFILICFCLFVNYGIFLGADVDIESTAFTPTYTGAATFTKQVTISTSAEITGNLDVGGIITGVGSGITNVDAETLDTLDSTAYAQLAATQTFTGQNTFNDFTSTGIDDNATSTAITIDSSENVSVGTTTANEVFNILGNIRLIGGSPSVRFHETDTVDQNWQQQIVSGRLRFGTQNDAFGSFSEKISFLNNGNVGIDTDSPDSLLTLGQGFLNFGDGVQTEYVIDASSEITAATTYFLVDTLGDAATDNLARINGGSIGDIILFRPAAGSRTVVLQDNGASGGNLVLAGNASFTMDDSEDFILMFGFGTFWAEISRSDN